MVIAIRVAVKELELSYHHMRTLERIGFPNCSNFAVEFLNSNPVIVMLVVEGLGTLNPEPGILKKVIYFCL